MLESKVDQEDHDGKDYRGHQHEQRRTLQLLPRGPGNLLSELLSTVFQIVNELSHLCLNGPGENWKRESLNLTLNIYQIVTFDIGRGSRIRTHIDGFGDR